MTPNGRRHYPYILHPDELSPLDLDRAKAKLQHVLKGKSPYDVIGEDGELTIKLTMWALVTRDDPDLSWEEAISTPFSAFPKTQQEPEPPPPSAANPSLSGSPPDAKPRKRSGTGSRAKPNSAASTASSPLSTTGSPSAS
jgi:hypothetical protein